MADNARRQEGQSIPTNMRLVLLLEEIGRAGVPITPTEANAVLGLPKPTVHRLFNTLEAEGLVQRDIDGKSFSPGRRLRTLSVNVLSSLRIRTARLAVLQKLAEEIGETCNIATSERDGMIYLDRVESKWPLRIQLPIGSAVPFHCTASGKMYLSSLLPSHLERFLAATQLQRHTRKTITDANILKDEIEIIRKRGYSTDDEEFMDEMVAVAVPIKDGRGRLMSTLSVHGPVQRLSLKDAELHLDLMHRTAEDLASIASNSES
ncbi:IclR family transcriptional regulator [Sedimentitalea todarodis]|uniref:IclR family transcriptional regulator n=1 Tax=Sedimentitalea todarodis TaxID=1631240 RepID=A0ABU3VDU1_9RHOB|nr:IclR family transcriptional regulator [Sedimentitalea todarodis]MDU9004329.1 IclR family transcriptional regulator [Sedimentitalea todarodis]